MLPRESGPSGFKPSQFFQCLTDVQVLYIAMLRRLLVFAFAAVLISADQHDNTVDIGATVKEVENMLAKDPRLPRLTRGEILKLIDEVRIGKDVVVVLPDNQNPAFNESDWTSTTAKPRRPVKRRRKKPSTVRPVYVHSTSEPTGSNNSSGLLSSSSTRAPISSGLDTMEWVTPTTTSHKVKITVGTPAPALTGGLPPVPGLELVDDINSWNMREKGVPDKKTENVFITPVPSTGSSATTPKTRIPSASEIQDSPPNVKVAAESLGPEMKDLLTRFGLLNPASTTERIYHGALPAPTIDPEVYSRFKPLRFDASTDFVSPDMKSFLASYGLLDTRRGKDLKTEATQESKSPLEYIPSREKEILTQLGLWRNGKAIDIGSANNMPKHVFKPKVEESNSKEKLEKVSQILTKLKEIGEGDETQLKQLSPSDVEELLQLENNTRLAEQGDIGVGINDPESLEEKNEVKRNPQDSSSSSASASASASASVGSSANAVATAEFISDDSGSSGTTPAETDSDAASSSVATTETITTTEGSSTNSDDTTERGASAVELEESFGGGGETTTKRPNGFYFLLDWNSFLDVGLDDQPSRAIHLNFSPKVGNPANFLPVTIGNGQPARRR